MSNIYNVNAQFLKFNKFQDPFFKVIKTDENLERIYEQSAKNETFNPILKSKYNDDVYITAKMKRKNKDDLKEDKYYNLTYEVSVWNNPASKKNYISMYIKNYEETSPPEPEIPWYEKLERTNNMDIDEDVFFF